jgi:hypothetical protein
MWVHTVFIDRLFFFFSDECECVLFQRRTSTVKIIDAGNGEADHHIVANLVSKVEVAITIHKKVRYIVQYSIFVCVLSSYKNLFVIRLQSLVLSE